MWQQKQDGAGSLGDGQDVLWVWLLVPILSRELGSVAHDDAETQLGGRAAGTGSQLHAVQAQQVSLQADNDDNNRLFMAPHLIRAQSTYKDIMICSIHHTHTHTHTYATACSAQHLWAKLSGASTVKKIYIKKPQGS